MNTGSPIELAEREIQRDKDDLKRLKKRYPGYDFVLVESKKLGIDSSSIRQPRADFTELEIAVLAVVNSLPDKEWTSRQILEELKSKTVTLPEKEDAALNAVGYALTALREAGKILRSHEGSGRDPHRYTAFGNEKEVIPEEKTS